MSDRPSRRYIVTAAAAVVALALGLLGPWAWAKIQGPSAKDRIEADPPPALFAESDIAPVDTWVSPEQRIAHESMRAYWKSHGRAAHDQEFLSWVGHNFPQPPKDRATEMSVLQDVKTSRTGSGVLAATWLEKYGKKDIWKLYAHDQAEWLPTATGEQRKDDVKAMLKLAKKATDDLSQRSQASSPYVLDRSLLDSRSKDRDPIEKLKSEKRPCPCSYPAGHAAKAAAARTYLGALQPHLMDQYRFMEDEIDWSRVYMAGHLPSDVAGGALLGDMIGEYFLVTRGHPAPAATA